MSAAVRAVLAATASTVEGIEVTANFRQSLSAGQGMVRRDRTDYPNFGGVVSWQVIVCLPKAMAAAEEWLDSKIPAVVAALATSRELTVTFCEPQQLPLGDGTTYPIALIQGIREQE